MRHRHPPAHSVLAGLAFLTLCLAPGILAFDLGAFVAHPFGGHGAAAPAPAPAPAAGKAAAAAATAAAAKGGGAAAGPRAGSSFSRQLRDANSVDLADAATVVTTATALNAADAASSTQLASGTTRRAHPLAKAEWCSKAEGKVSRVDCWINDAGIITGVQLSDDMGIPMPGLCATEGRPVSGGMLAETESIVEIKACKANTLASPKGYSYLEFWTDGGRSAPIVCGALPAKSSCEVINAGKVPKWHAAPAPAAKWYREAGGYSPYKYRYNGRHYDKSSTFDPASGAYGQEPAYFREVFPLSELKAKCNKAGHLTKLESACWNKRFRPKPRSMLLGVVLTMNDYYTCPKHAAELDPLICYVTNSVEEQLDHSGQPVKVKAAPVECKSDAWHNTTISFVVKVHALKLKAHDKVNLAHKVMDQFDSRDLCEDYQVGMSCDAHGVYAWQADQLFKLPKGSRFAKGATCTAQRRVHYGEELEGYPHYFPHWLQDDEAELPAYEDWYGQQQPLPPGGAYGQNGGGGGGYGSYGQQQPPQQQQPQPSYPDYGGLMHATTNTAPVVQQQQQQQQQPVTQALLPQQQHQQQQQKAAVRQQNQLAAAPVRQQLQQPLSAHPPQQKLAPVKQAHQQPPPQQHALRQQQPQQQHLQQHAQHQQTLQQHGARQQQQQQQQLLQRPAVRQQQGSRSGQGRNGQGAPMAAPQHGTNTVWRKPPSVTPANSQQLRQQQWQPQQLAPVSAAAPMQRQHAQQQAQAQQAHGGGDGVSGWLASQLYGIADALAGGTSAASSHSS